MSTIPRWQRTSPLSYLALAAITFLSIFPFYWMFVVSSNTNAEISKSPPSLIPGGRFLIVAEKVMSAEGVYFNTALMNTFIVGISIAVAQVVFSAIAGFAFAKLNFRGRKFFILFIRLASAPSPENIFLSPFINPLIESIKPLKKLAHCFAALYTDAAATPAAI